MNQAKESTPLLHNGNGSQTSIQALLKAQQGPAERPGDYDLSMEARLAFLEKSGLNNGLADYTKWDQINMNVSRPPTDNAPQPDQAGRPENGAPTPPEPDARRPYPMDNDMAERHLLNGNQPAAAAGADLALSRSTEELSPERRSHGPQVVKAHSVSNIEAGGMKLYAFEGDADPYDPYDPASAALMARISSGPAPAPQGQSIVRSKSAGQLLSDQALQLHPSSASSSDLLKGAGGGGRYAIPPPQYNIQYTSSAMPKDGLWAQRTPMPPEQQAYLPPPPPHSLANTNYSNRNQAPPYPAQQRGPLPADVWGPPRSSTLHRQSSSASSTSAGDYLTYRDIHSLARGPLAMSQAAQRPLSARTYSVDVPGGAPRGPAGRPQPHELPERTMSVSDFNYQHGSPSKRPNARVKSEHSLLDGPGPTGTGGRVPADWRDQVMRHIEAKKMEKVNVVMILEHLFRIQ